MLSAVASRGHGTADGHPVHRGRRFRLSPFSQRAWWIVSRRGSRLASDGALLTLISLMESSGEPLVMAFMEKRAASSPLLSFPE